MFAMRLSTSASFQEVNACGLHILGNFPFQEPLRGESSKLQYVESSVLGVAYLLHGQPCHFNC